MGMTDKQFAAFCRKLLRVFDKIEDALDNDELDKAKEFVRELYSLAKLFSKANEYNRADRGRVSGKIPFAV